MGLPVDSKKQEKDTWVSMVLKRGKQQRYETPRIKYDPLKDDPNDRERNRKLYQQMVTQYGMESSQDVNQTSSTTDLSLQMDDSLEMDASGFEMLNGKDLKERDMALSISSQSA